MSFDDFADLGDFNYDEFEYDGGGGVSDDGSEFSYDGYAPTVEFSYDGYAPTVTNVQSDVANLAARRNAARERRANARAEEEEMTVTNVQSDVANLAARRNAAREPLLSLLSSRVRAKESEAKALRKAEDAEKRAKESKESEEEALKKAEESEKKFKRSEKKFKRELLDTKIKAQNDVWKAKGAEKKALEDVAVFVASGLDAELKAESAEKRAQDALRKAEDAEKRAEESERKVQDAEKRVQEMETEWDLDLFFKGILRNAREHQENFGHSAEEVVRDVLRDSYTRTDELFAMGVELVKDIDDEIADKAESQRLEAYEFMSSFVKLYGEGSEECDIEFLESTSEFAAMLEKDATARKEEEVRKRRMGFFLKALRDDSCLICKRNFADGVGTDIKSYPCPCSSGGSARFIHASCWVAGVECPQCT